MIGDPTVYSTTPVYNPPPVTLAPQGQPVIPSPQGQPMTPTPHQGQQMPPTDQPASSSLSERRPVELCKCHI